MLEILKIIHFFGLIMGIGGGMANAMAAKRLVGMPGEAMPTIGAFREALGKLSTLGLILVWLSGIAMIWGYRGGLKVFDDTTFTLKIAAVVVLTVFAIYGNMTVAKAKKAGTPPDAGKMRTVSMGALTFGTLALILAVVNFT